ncbi:MAG TPA: cytochrome b/b6 domain-containing protein [Candidatus Dormibacteraeota bacterium]|nr:cytochrome b/b6 domain-containing protein [Candidatus Dormibacteraeota bacterium]
MSADIDRGGFMEQTDQPARYHVRFTLGQRYLHAVVFSTFIGLALTGLPLRFSHSAWAEGFAHAVGGFAAILFFHKFCGVLLTAAFLIHLGDLFRRGAIKKEKGIFWGPDSLVPRGKDFVDLYRHIRWFFWRGPRPKFDRYAYWEKFDYWAVFWGMAIIGLSGYAMWFAPLAAKIIPGSWLNIALVLHGEEALLAVWFIFVVHFFNTHLRPGSFPMDLVIFTGKERDKEFQEKRPVEYERLRQEGRLEGEMTTVAPARWLKNFGRIVGAAIIVTGFILLVLTLATFFNA